MKAYRLCGRSRDPRDPSGALKRGGRWNKPGVAVLYCASSLSLACLEQLVHIRNPENLPSFHYAEVSIPRELITPWGSRSGIMGIFDFHLEYGPDLTTPGWGPPPVEATGPSILTAIQDQVGLKLVPAKGPGEFLVIDSVERPSEN
jgi:hypothetical protein